MEKAPFTNFDPTKFKLGTRGEGSAATDVEDSPETADDAAQGQQAAPGAEGGQEEGQEGQQQAGEGSEGQESQEEGSGEAAQEEVQEGQGEEPSKEGDEAAAQQQSAYTQDDFATDVSDFLSEVTGGAVKDAQGINSILQENARLKSALEKKELDFPSDRAKLIYDFALKAEGLELSAASQYIRLQQLDLKTLSPKEKQFEAFVLSRPDLTRERANQIFEAKYEGEFGQMTQEDIVLQDAHDQKTREAEGQILKHQKEFQDATKSVQPGAQDADQVRAIEAGVTQVLSDFGGIVARFGESDEDVVQVPLKDEDVSSFTETLKNPQSIVSDIIAQCQTADGKFDWNKYANIVFRIKHHDQIVQQTRDNGIAIGQLRLVKERKNTTVPKATNGKPLPAKPTFAQAMATAVKAAAAP